MKNVLLSMVILLIIIGKGYSQITTLDPDFKSNIENLFEKPIIYQYDSSFNISEIEDSKNFSGNLEDYESYCQQFIGQKVYCPKDNYYIGIKFSPQLQAILLSDTSLNIEEIPCFNKFEAKLIKGNYTITNIELENSKIKFSQNKVFERIRLIEEKTERDFCESKIYRYGGYMSGNRYLPKLVELTSEKGEIYYIPFPSNRQTPEYGMETMVFVGYFEKVKQLNLNKTFYIFGDGYTKEDKITDLVTDKEIILKRTTLEDFKKGIGHPFKCTSVSLYDYKGSMIIVSVLENSDSKFVVGAGIPIYRFQNGCFTPKELYDKELKERALNIQQQNNLRNLEAKKEQEKRLLILQKYGKIKGENILNGKVSIGMTKSMCQDAWGVPNDTKKTTNSKGTNEIWIYNYKTKLIFENEILIQIEN